VETARDKFISIEVNSYLIKGIFIPLYLFKGKKRDKLGGNNWEIREMRENCRELRVGVGSLKTVATANEPVALLLNVFKEIKRERKEIRENMGK